MPKLVEFQLLPLGPLTGQPSLTNNGHQAHLTDPAINEMTDLRMAPCITVDHLDGVNQTVNILHHGNVHMAFVTGVGAELIGMVTIDDLQGERPMLRAMSDHVSIEDLTIEQLMTPVSQWQAVDVFQIEHSRIGNVAATMRHHGLNYLLVVERKDGGTQIRGLFSARRLESALGLELVTGPVSRSFAEVEAALVR